MAIHGNPSLEFEAASVRPDKSRVRARSNVSLTSSDEFQPTGGLFDAVNISPISYIAFAYKLTNKQLQQVVAQAPWTADEPFDIQARAEGNPTKDDFRIMMQALLRDRFKFRAHFEAKEVPVYGLMLVKTGKWGPQLRPHKVNDPVCAGAEPAANTEDAQYPKICAGISGMPPSEPGRIKSGARGISMTLFANIMSGVGVTGRPLVDETGLTEPVDSPWSGRRLRRILHPTTNLSSMRPHPVSRKRSGTTRAQDGGASRARTGIRG